MIDYSTFVDPLAVRATAVRIVAPYANRYPWNWHQAAAIFEFVKAEVSYVPDPRGIDYVASPTETLEVGGGDCDDHAVLLSSLYEAVGIPTRVVLCRSNRRRHVLCQVDFGRQHGDVVAKNLKAFYRLRCHTPHRFYWQCDGGDKLWLCADTVLCSYLGDIQGLVMDGYIEGETGKCNWHYPPSYFAREAGEVHLSGPGGEVD
jgi:hypothetical protein